MAREAGRIEYLDVMRATLMLLGVVLHASQIYNPSGPWLIKADDGSVFFHHLSESINAFRMPAFFFLSGFLSTMLALRKGPRVFLLLRLERIAFPLITTALTLNILQTWLLDRTHWIDSGIYEYFLDGVWVQHLWFLVNLLVYVCLLASVARIRGLSAWFRLFGSALGRVPFHALLLALPLLSVGLAATGKIGIPVYTEFLGITTLITLLQYLPFFGIGCLAYVNAGLFDKLTQQKPPALLLAAAFAIAFGMLLPAGNSLLERVGRVYFHYFVNWLCICGFISCFRLLIHRITPSWKYLSEASYTVYLFHHLVVVCLGLVFINLGTPAPVAFVIIVLLTLAITFSLHSVLIARYRPLSLLFNGRSARETVVTDGVKTGISREGSGLYRMFRTSSAATSSRHVPTEKAHSMSPHRSRDNLSHGREL